MKYIILLVNIFMLPTLVHAQKGHPFAGLDIHQYEMKPESKLDVRLEPSLTFHPSGKFTTACYCFVFTHWEGRWEPMTDTSVRLIIKHKLPHKVITPIEIRNECIEDTTRTLQILWQTENGLKRARSSHLHRSKIIVTSDSGLFVLHDSLDLRLDGLWVKGNDTFVSSNLYGLMLDEQSGSNITVIMSEPQDSLKFEYQVIKVPSDDYFIYFHTQEEPVARYITLEKMRGIFREKSSIQKDEIRQDFIKQMEGE